MCIRDSTLTYLEKFDLKTSKIVIAIEPHLSIYNIPIEQYILKITSRSEIKLFDLRTIGNSIANIKANPNGEFLNLNNHLEISNFTEDDAAETAQILVKYFEKLALPYYNQFANWLGLDSIFNNTAEHSKWSVHCVIAVSYTHLTLPTNREV